MHLVSRREGAGGRSDHGKNLTPAITSSTAISAAMMISNRSKRLVSMMWVRIAAVHPPEIRAHYASTNDSGWANEKMFSRRTR
jgi:hypothetical protein